MPFGYARLSSICQRPGRTGYYLRIAVPRELRTKLSCNSVVRKLGNTHREALANRRKVEAEIERSFGAELNTLSLVEKVQEAYGTLPEMKGLSLGELPTSDKENIRDAYPIQLDDKGQSINSEEDALWRSLDGKSTWQEWVNRREAVEGRAKATINNWKTNLKGLAVWVGSDFLSELTKSQAIQYKEHMLTNGREPSSVKNTLGCLNAFWVWGIEHEIIKENIWSGLKKRLPDSEKKPIPAKEVFDAATLKAATITSHRKTKDYQFLIQRYTGCRQGEAAGLRHCDIDLKDKTITFEQWEKIVRYKKERGGVRKEKQVRRFKTGVKDERCLPMSSALYEAIKDMALIDGSDDPIWPRRYKATDDSWGAHWVSEYRNKYNLLSHDLRRFAVTKLNNAGVSPYILFEITRHKVTGMSDVVAQYTRPTTEELRKAIELLV